MKLSDKAANISRLSGYDILQANLVQYVQNRTIMYPSSPKLASLQKDSYSVSSCILRSSGTKHCDFSRLQLFFPAYI